MNRQNVMKSKNTVTSYMNRNNEMKSYMNRMNVSKSDREIILKQIKWNLDSNQRRRYSKLKTKSYMLKC